MRKRPSILALVVTLLLPAGLLFTSGCDADECVTQPPPPSPPSLSNGAGGPLVNFGRGVPQPQDQLARFHPIVRDVDPGGPRRLGGMAHEAWTSTTIRRLSDTRQSVL